MLRETCRVCHQGLYPVPLLTYKNMPKSAQLFPEEDVLSEELGLDIMLHQCGGCGLVQLSNPPVHYFREVIRAAGISSEMKLFRQQQFSDWITHYDLIKKRVLEVGCGQGEYLSLLAEMDIEAYGIEFGTQSVNVCKQHGLNVERTFIEDEEIKLASAPFDAFVMLNFLEHLPDPNASLQGIAKNLVQGAIGLVEVPNFDMILRKNMFSEFISDHLFYFTRETFISTLTRNGFEVLECSETWHDYSLSAVVRKRDKLDLSRFSDYQQALTRQLHDYISQFPENEVAIWGAGHQALAVMSLAGLQDKIKYVVDSAPFKQGKYTPATHLAIVAPAMLETDPVAAVIVMAASYSDEVVSIIQERYGTLKLAVLNDTNLIVIN